jgi:CRP/FNR family transcriptional regulator, cyclic AMP receptor protein
MSPPSFEPRDLNALLEYFETGARLIRIRKKQLMFSQGDPADSIFYIKEGSVKLSVISENGREAVISLCRSGSFLGEDCILSGSPTRLCSAVALTNASFLKMEGNSISRMLRSDARVANAFILYLLNHMFAIQRDLTSSLVDSKEQRLARVLLSLAHSREGEKPELIRGITQQTLAQMVGTSRQRVNILLKRFRRLGFIQDSDAPRTYPMPEPRLSNAPSAQLSLLQGAAEAAGRFRDRKANSARRRGQL